MAASGAADQVAASGAAIGDFNSLIPYLPPSYLNLYTLDRIYSTTTANLNQFSRVIGFNSQLWRLLDEGAKAYFAYRFMYTHVRGNVLFVMDGINRDRFFLGPASEFTSGTRVLVLARDRIPVYYPTAPEVFLPPQPRGNYGVVPRRLIHAHAKIPRPPNAYIIYRKERHHIVKQNLPGITNNEISQLLGEAWSMETDETRLFYKALANEEKRKLMEAHPDYRYQPRKPGVKKRRSRALQNVETVA